MTKKDLLQVVSLLPTPSPPKLHVMSSAVMRIQVIVPCTPAWERIAPLLRPFAGKTPSRSSMWRRRAFWIKKHNANANTTSYSSALLVSLCCETHHVCRFPSPRHTTFSQSASPEGSGSLQPRLGTLSRPSS